MSKPEPSETEGKLIFQDDVKLFNVVGILAILDSPFFDYSEVNVKFRNPVSVKDTQRKKIGFANIFLQNGKIAAELSIDYHCPERLDIENKNGVFLNAVGSTTGITASVNSIDFYGKKQKIKEIVIYSLIITDKRPLDSRISVLGEPVLL